MCAAVLAVLILGIDNFLLLFFGQSCQGGLANPSNICNYLLFIFSLH